MVKYGFIGTGSMAQAMIQGLIHKNILPSDIAVSSPGSAAKLSEKWGVCLLYTSPSPRDA